MTRRRIAGIAFALVGVLIAALLAAWLIGASAIDLRMARDVQRSLLPQQIPAFLPDVSAGQPGLRFCCRYQPAVAVGGDFFDVLQLSNTQAGILICDVMGHGLRAALVTALLRGVIEELRPMAAEPGRFLTAINEGLHRVLQTIHPPLFVSACYLVADVARREFRYARAGHPLPLLVRRRDHAVTSLPYPAKPEAVALGLMPDQTYQTACCGLQPNDLMVLYTDGLFEVEGAEGELFGQDGLRRAVTAHQELPAEALFDRLLEEVRAFSVDHQFADDVCLVGLEVYENN